MPGKKRIDNDIDFSISKNSELGSVLLNGYNYKGIIEKLGLPTIAVTLDIDENGRHILTLTPDANGTHIIYKKNTLNSWQLTIRPTVGKKVLQGNYTGFRYWRLSWVEIKTDIGIFHKLLIDLDDRTPKTEQLTISEPQPKDNDRIKHIEDMLVKICKELEINA